MENLTDNEYLKAHEAERTKCEIWTRCMGYHRPVENFNAGKQSEFRERKMFKESVASSSMEMIEIK